MTTPYQEIYGGFIVEKYFLEAWYREVEEQEGEFVGAPRQFLGDWSKYLDNLRKYHDQALGKTCDQLKTEYIGAVGAPGSNVALSPLGQIITLLNGVMAGNDYLTSLHGQIVIERDAAEYIRDQLDGMGVNCT